MALLIDYTQTKFGIPYTDAYLRIVTVSFGKPPQDTNGAYLSGTMSVTYHVFASQAAADASLDNEPLEQGTLALPYTITDTVSFATVYPLLKSSFENPRDV